MSKVYINLIDQKEPTLNFQNENAKIANNTDNLVPYYKKIIRPSSNEIKKHKEYLSKNLKKNYY